MWVLASRWLGGCGRILRPCSSVARCERSRDYISGGRGARGRSVHGWLAGEDTHLPLPLLPTSLLLAAVHHS